MKKCVSYLKAGAILAAAVMAAGNVGVTLPVVAVTNDVLHLRFFMPNLPFYDMINPLYFLLKLNMKGRYYAFRTCSDSLSGAPRRRSADGSV